MFQFDEYQRRSAQTRLNTATFAYLVLGLASEAGEVAGKYKKVIRGDTPLTESFKTAIAYELGDVLWYISQIASDLNIPLSTIAQNNIDKLLDRKERSHIQGDGDVR